MFKLETNKLTFLDGSPEEQKNAIEEFLNSVTPEDHARAMSSEFDYLEDE